VDPVSDCKFTSGSRQAKVTDKKEKNEEIHVVTCRMFSYKGRRLLHGGQRIDFFKPKKSGSGSEFT
jgi:hypothetical protein